MYPQQNTQSSDVEVDLFHKYGKATLEVAKVMDSVDIALYWYSINTNLELGFDHVDFYQNGVLSPNATLQAATVDLDKHTFRFRNRRLKGESTKKILLLDQ